MIKLLNQRSGQFDRILFRQWILRALVDSGQSLIWIMASYVLNNLRDLKSFQVFRFYNN